eukprot:TRINITY_DN38861_c0_g1_i1.p1 TRINITY_DN38861_c0_g1~~TRINITY_DN38861_c0_g1_i1.p1  ORF type:complete len:326 (+),score=55.42 TRINITY_DN38861_c0_g1_i1:194-1171(+)
MAGALDAAVVQDAASSALGGIVSPSSPRNPHSTRAAQADSFSEDSADRFGEMKKKTEQFRLRSAQNLRDAKLDDDRLADEYAHRRQMKWQERRADVQRKRVDWHRKPRQQRSVKQPPDEQEPDTERERRKAAAKKTLRVVKVLSALTPHASVVAATVGQPPDSALPVLVEDQAEGRGEQPQEDDSVSKSVVSPLPPLEAAAVRRASVLSNWTEVVSPTGRPSGVLLPPISPSLEAAHADCVNDSEAGSQTSVFGVSHRKDRLRRAQMQILRDTKICYYKDQLKTQLAQILRAVELSPTQVSEQEMPSLCPPKQLQPPSNRRRAGA